MSFFKQNKCAIPLGFLLAYGIPLIIAFSGFTNDLRFWLRLIGLVAFINVFTQVMLGSFRRQLNNIYEPIRVYWIHNYLGAITLILALIHGLGRAWLSNSFGALLFNTSWGVGVGVGALYIMLLTVITSDFKYFFKINIKASLWRGIHVLNYAMFVLIYVHAFSIGTDFQHELMRFMGVTFMMLTLIAIIIRIRNQVRK